MAGSMPHLSGRNRPVPFSWPSSCYYMPRGPQRFKSRERGRTTTRNMSIPRSRFLANVVHAVPPIPSTIRAAERRLGVKLTNGT